MWIKYFNSIISLAHYDWLLRHVHELVKGKFKKSLENV